MTLQEWISILKRSAESQDPDAARGSEVQSIATNGNSYFTVVQTQIDSSTSRLSLPQIVEISVAKCKEVRERYLKNEIKETDYIDLTNDLSDYTTKLITTWETKRNHSTQQLFRKIALFLSALFSFVIIGIPFFIKLLNENKKFKVETDQLKQKILQANEANSHAMLIKKLDNIPAILKEIKERYKDHRRQELINTQLVRDWQDDEKIQQEFKSRYDEEFERDIKRGASFLRIDQASNIEDQKPIPAQNLEGDQRVQAGASFLKELLKKPEDKRWEPVLQIAVTHACLLTAFKAALSAFNIDAARVQWEANGKYYSIKSTFSEKSPPVLLEIIRDPDNGTIKMVHVTVKGSMDIVSYNTIGHEDPKIIVHDAITEELKYAIAFGEDNRPQISDLNSQIDAKISST